MFLKLKCIAICLVLILTLNLAACLFVPETKTIKNNDCQLVTKKWSLEFKKADISGRVDGEILVAIGAVAVGSLVVSGSVVVVGNTIHWLEQQGFCDDSITQKTVDAPNHHHIVHKFRHRHRSSSCRRNVKGPEMG